MCHFLHRQLKVRLFSQAADLSLLPAWNGRLAPLQRPSQGILSTTASTKRTQTLQTAWTSFWPDSSLGKVWSDCWYRIREQRMGRENKMTAFPFSLYLSSHYMLIFPSSSHPSFCSLRSFMLCFSPTIWHFPPPSGLLSSSFHACYSPNISACALYHSRLPNSWPHSLLPLSPRIGFFLSSKRCVTTRPAELMDRNRNTASQHELDQQCHLEDRPYIIIIQYG